MNEPHTMLVWGFEDNQGSGTDVQMSWFPQPLEFPRVRADNEVPSLGERGLWWWLRAGRWRHRKEAARAAGAAGAAGAAAGLALPCMDAAGHTRDADRGQRRTLVRSAIPPHKDASNRRLSPPGSRIRGARWYLRTHPLSKARHRARHDTVPHQDEDEELEQRYTFEELLNKVIHIIADLA